MGSSIAEQAHTSHNTIAKDAPTTTAAVVLSRMAACLGHHVNNGLTAVIGYLELSLRDAAGKGNHQSHLQAGLASAYQAADTVKRLVAFASQKVSSNVRSSVSLRQLAEETALKVARTFASGYRVVLTGDSESLVIGDETLIRASLEQIILNAVEAMAPEGTLTLHLDEKPGRGRLHIRDTGPGLSAEATAHLFDPFWTTKRNGHLGLGLILSRDLLAAQGGTLSVASAPGAGTTVTLSLPAETAQVTSPSFEDDAATVLAPTSGALLPA